MITVGKIIASNSHENCITDDIRDKFSSFFGYLAYMGIIGIDNKFYYEEKNKLILICNFFYQFENRDNFISVLQQIETPYGSFMNYLAGSSPINILRQLELAGFEVSVNDNDSVLNDSVLYETSPNWKEEDALIMYVPKLPSPFGFRDHPSFLGNKTRLYVPLPELPLSFEKTDSIMCWHQEYQIIYSTFILSQGQMEKKSLYEISAPHSDLTTYGKDIADEISESLKMPVYYYLYSDKKRKKEIRCSNCHKNITDTFNGGFYFCDICKFVFDFYE
jgi:hypothetical protein